MLISFTVIVVLLMGKALYDEIAEGMSAKIFIEGSALILTASCLIGYLFNERTLLFVALGILGTSASIANTIIDRNRHMRSQLPEDKVSYTADILSCVFYFMLTGVVIFPLCSR